MTAKAAEAPFWCSPSRAGRPPVLRLRREGVHRQQVRNGFQSPDCDHLGCRSDRRRRTGSSFCRVATRTRPLPWRPWPNIPVLIANSRGAETLEEFAAGIGPRVTPMSALRPHRTFRAEQEGPQRVELTRSASSQRMAAICALSSPIVSAAKVAATAAQGPRLVLSCSQGASRGLVQCTGCVRPWKCWPTIAVVGAPNYLSIASMVCCNADAGTRNNPE
jgi:hypothetical protein